MKINITSRHFKAHDSLQDHVTDRLNELEKYNEQILFADVILSFDKPPHELKHCEIILKLRDKLFTSKESSDDFAKSVDMAVEKVEVQLQKYKDISKAQKHSDKEVYKSI